MRYEINTYRDRRRAERATAYRSLNADRRGHCSQFEVRQLGPEGYVGGLQGDLAVRFPAARIVRQYSAGYSL